MHISELAPNTWSDAMQPVGPAPIGAIGALPSLGVPSPSSKLSSSLEVFVLLTMSAVTSLLLCVVAAGAF